MQLRQGKPAAQFPLKDRGEGAKTAVREGGLGAFPFRGLPAMSDLSVYLAPLRRGSGVPRYKRAFDICLVLLALPAIWPLFLILAAAVRLSGPGPVFFVQTRVGLNGRPFGMVKFRSMYPDAESRRAMLEAQSERAGVCFKLRDDPRVTPVGRFLRRSSLDELPQLFNVLTGDMSLVGPRPALPQEVAAYPHAAMGRLAALPGITGPWQVAGRADLDFAQMVDLDLDYVRAPSLGRDLAILWRTVAVVASGQGAY
jgi:lipopolysaccharide/colanic/teichoic acid biosynthesis glycosyltransferase